MHRLMAETLDTRARTASAPSSRARATDASRCERPKWPMIVLRSPKGWTGPKEVDGLKVEGFWRAHQVPIADPRGNPEHLKLLEAWMRSYQPEKLFDENGRLCPNCRRWRPTGNAAHGRQSRTPMAGC